MFDSAYTGTDSFIALRHSMDTASIFIDDVAWEPIPCFAPSDLYAANISTDAADIGWTENRYATQWQVRYGITGFDTTGVSPVLVNTNPYLLSGLSSNTTYDFYVRAYCGAGDSSVWAGPESFTTTSSESGILPFIEDWESNHGLRKTDGLIYQDTNYYYWSFETSHQSEGRLRWGDEARQSHDGAGALTMDKYPNTGSYAINYAILTLDLSDYTTNSDLELWFWWADHSDEDHQRDKVWVRGSDSDDWVEIYDLNPATTSDNTYQSVSGLDIDATLANASPAQTVSATFQLRFGQEDNSFTPGDGISFDDIIVKTSDCASPSDLIAGNITTTSTDLSWTENGGAATWEIRTGIAGFDTTGVAPTIITQKPYTLNGLLPDISYDWYIRAICDGPEYSDWSGPGTFTTELDENLAATLPFLEDWETQHGSRNTDGLIYESNSYSWSFETSVQAEGTVSWGDQTMQAYQGNGALTMDKYPNTGVYAVNYAVLTIDLINYTSSSDLELSFAWVDHSDEEHSNDKVWIRGSDIDEWVEAYDLEPSSAGDNSYQLVSGIDIDALLAAASPPQTVSSTFQLRLGQEDNSFTPGDGISYDNIRIEASTCPAPSNQSVSNITLNTAFLQWTENGVSSSWEIMVDVAGFDTTGYTPQAIANNPYAISGLSVGTSYEWYIRSTCGGGDNSNWVGPHSFTTQFDDISAATLPFLEDWETQDGIRNTDGFMYEETSYNWYFITNIQGDGNASWGTNAWQAYEGNGALTMDKYPNTGSSAVNYSILTLNLINYTTSGDLELSFWWVDHSDEEHANDKVWIRGSDTDDWIVIYDLNPVSTPDNVYQFVSSLDIDATLAAGSPSQTVSETFQVRFGQEDNSFTPGDGMTFDNIQIKTATCPTPSGLSATNITQTDVDLSWAENGNSGNWELMIGLTGFDTAGATPISISSNPYTVSGLNPGASYDWYIRSDCGNEDYSDWSGPATFVTEFGGISPATLPFIEDWETDNGTIKINGEMYIATTYQWSFETNKPNEGRGRWGTNSYTSHSGGGAFSIDKYPNTGSYAINYATLTLNLANYTSSNDLELSFWWNDHSEEEHANDKIWVRGSDTGDWIMIYDLDPVPLANNTWNYVSGLDIDDVLASASPPQTVSSSFQMRIGQEDNSFTPGDGMTFDEITIEDLSKSAQAQLQSDSPDLQLADGFNVFSHHGDIYLRSLGRARDEAKTVYIYDGFGKKIYQQQLDPSSQDKITFTYRQNYYVVMMVKVVSENYITIEKVFIDMK
jgi:hypothetical protein